MKSISSLFLNRVHKKVSIVSSAVFVLIAAMITILFVSSARDRYLADLKRKVTEFALIGADQSREMFLEAVQENHLTIAELLDENYQRINLEEFRSTYISADDQDTISDDYVRLLMDRVVERDVDEYYRYHTAYDRTPFLNRRVLQIEEPFLEMENVDYAVLIDRNGYIPFHHLVNSQNLTGDLKTDTFGNRAKRIWRSTLGETQIPGEISYYVYRRDTGTPYLNVNAPIVINGNYWGAFLVGYNATEIDVAVAALQRNAILFILAVVLLIVTIYSIFIIISLRPLSVLLNGVRRIEQGHLDVSIPVRSQDEIGYLSGAFNGMVSSIRVAEEQLKAYAEDLQASNEKLADYSHTLEEKVEARTKDLHGKNVELERTLQQLRETQNQLVLQARMASLGQLVAGVAHEINSPVGAIRCAADVAGRCMTRVEAAVEEPSAQKPLAILRDNVRLIGEAGQRIGQMVQTLRTFARMDEAEFKIADLREGLESALDLLRPQLRDEIRIVRDLGEVTPIYCSPGQLNQVFMSILTSMGQAIDGEGEIAVECDQDAGHIYIRMRDTENAIPPDRYEQIFDFHFRADGDRVRMDPGLATSYRIVQQHGGEIRIESENAKGTVVSVVLPIVRSESDRDSRAQRR